MAPYANDEPLSRKHKQYNKQLRDVIAKGEEALKEKQFTKDENDRDNLKKIDIANNSKDVEYILSVLKSDDLLYVSRAIKGSVWLLDDQYADFINPRYLNENLFPHMKVKAAAKFLKHIRQHLKTEKRVEEFYNDEANPKVAVKWLARCSVPFIESNVGKHMSHVQELDFKRICERSVTIFEIAMRSGSGCDGCFKAASFLLNTHPDLYLDVFENYDKYPCGRHKFGPTATDTIMKKVPQRITNNFLKYVDFIHISTFIDNIKQEEIKRFLFELANKNDKKIYGYRFCNIFKFEIIKKFLLRMAEKERFEFVSKVFLDSENILKIDDDTLERGTEMYSIKQLCGKVCPNVPTYRWYEFAPFNIALEEIKKLIHTETNYHDKYSMFEVLLTCADKNTDDLLTLLGYFFKTSMNDEEHLKKDFTNKLLKQAEIYYLSEETSNAFVEIVNNLNVEKDNQEYVRIVIVYNVVHNKEIDAMFKEAFEFDTLKQYRKSLKVEDQEKVFKYLYDLLVEKLGSITQEKELEEASDTINNLLTLLLDWEKQLTDYPLILTKIKELVRLKRENGWKTNLSSLYNKNKSWRRHMFEESVGLDPSQKVCINALKHDPGLLARYGKEVEDLSCNDAISLKQFLKKIRIYWPETLAANTVKAYHTRLDKQGQYKALTRGICTLLSQEPLLEILKKYAPTESKINWDNIDEVTLNLQRYFAKTMHIARPQPPAEVIMMYAKGDFLQHALPSLLAIFHNMGSIESQQHIPKLLDAPVSLQKHGLRFAFKKLNHEQLKFHLRNIWQSTKNVTIRAVTFVLLFDLMCKAKDASRAEELWEIIEICIDNLTFTEDNKIYEKLDSVESVPENVKPKFLIKSYGFLKNLLPTRKNDKYNYECKINKLINYTRSIMESMPVDFMENIIKEHIDSHFFETENSEMFNIISCYLLCAKDEKTQMEKYDRILSPLIERGTSSWSNMEQNRYIIRNNIRSVLTNLYKDFSNYAVDKKMIIPTEMFKRIKIQLDLYPLPPNYTMLRKWNLIQKLAEIVKNLDNPGNWEEINPLIVPEFGKYCLQVLKEDVKSAFPCIYVLYSKVLKAVVCNDMPQEVCLPIYKELLEDKDFVPAHLVVLQLLPGKGHYYRRSKDCDEMEKDMKESLRQHPSVEVRMHYYMKYPDNDLGI